MSFAALRIAQLDSEILDNEFLEIINSLLDFNVGELSDSPRWQQIYRNVKRSVPVIYYLHQYFKGLSPGQSLMGVEYKNFDGIRSFLNLLLNHIAPTIVKYLSDESHNIQLQKIVRRLETGFMVANLVHFLYFLANGGPSNLLRRILGIYTVHKEKPTIGDINLSSLNRELLGHSIASLIILLTPLYHLISRQVANYLDRRRKLVGDGECQKSSDGLILCDRCKNVAIVPVSALATDQIESIFCNYCYYVAKRSQNFVSVKLLNYGQTNKTIQ